MEWSQHALEKLRIYEIASEAIEGASVRQELRDRESGALLQVVEFQNRPWVMVISAESGKVMTVYPTDEKTLEHRIKSGRWSGLKRSSA